MIAAHPIGLKLWSINTGAYLREAVRLYREGVFDYLELYMVPETLMTVPMWYGTGIPCIVHAPHSKHGINLADMTKRVYNLAIFDEVRRFADGLQADRIIVHGGILGETEEIIHQLKMFNDPRVLIENKPLIPIDRRPVWLAGSTPAEIERIIHGVGCGFCLDIGHMIVSANAHNDDWRDYLCRFLMLQPNMFHLSDLSVISDVDQHLHFGCGTLPLSEILSTLPEDLSISVETEKNAPGELEDFRKDCAVLNAFWGDASC